MKKKKLSLNPNSILEKEFEYTSQTAFQANEDRVRVFTYFIATGSGLIATVLFLNLDRRLHLAIFAAIFAAFCLLGFFSYLKLIKLRLSWDRSVRAMNQIKEYYIKNINDKNFENAFLWRTGTIPNPGKIWSIAFLMSQTIAIIATGSFTAAVLLLTRLLSGGWILEYGVIAGILSYGFLIALWFTLARSKK